MAEFCIPPVIVTPELQRQVRKIVELNEPINSILRGDGVVYQPIICETMSACMREVIDFEFTSNTVYDSEVTYDDDLVFDMNSVISTESITSECTNPLGAFSDAFNTEEEFN